jgi:hypothetical protein
MNMEQFLKPLKSNIIQSVDNIDPISLNVFWELENEKKKVVYPKNEYKNLILYFDSMRHIRCFEKESLQYMKSYNVTKHPVTNEELPSYLFDNIDMVDIEALHSNDRIEDIAFNVFQYFSKISIFIDSEWFFKLEKPKLLRLNYEMKDFWLQNYNEEQRNDITSEQVFILSTEELDKIELESIQKYLLNQMKMILKCEKEEYRYMINYIILGALGLFITEIKELYPDFSFTF